MSSFFHPTPIHSHDSLHHISPSSPSPSLTTTTTNSTSLSSSSSSFYPLKGPVPPPLNLNCQLTPKKFSTPPTPILQLDSILFPNVIADYINNDDNNGSDSTCSGSSSSCSSGFESSTSSFDSLTCESYNSLNLAPTTATKKAVNVAYKFIDIPQLECIIQSIDCEIYPFQKQIKEQQEQALSHYVIVDCRENRLYQTLHVKHAYSASCHTRTMTKRSITQWPIICPTNNDLLQLKSITAVNKKVILYDNKSSNENGLANDHLLCFIKHLIHEGYEIFIIDGGWCKLKECLIKLPNLFESSIGKDLINRYTFSPTNRENESDDIINETMSKINDYIYLGNERDAHDLELLQQAGITHILNVTNDVDNYFENLNNNSIKYRRLAASDNHSQDLIQFFIEAFEFIEQVRESSGRLLVHCWAGVSRSPTIVISYFIRKLACDVSSAMDIVRTRRKIVAPNFNFMGQLERFYNTHVKLTLQHQQPQTPSTAAIVEEHMEIDNDDDDDNDEDQNNCKPKLSLSKSLFEFNLSSLTNSCCVNINSISGSNLHKSRSVISKRNTSFRACGVVSGGGVGGMGGTSSLRLKMPTISCSNSHSVDHLDNSPCSSSRTAEICP